MEKGKEPVFQHTLYKKVWNEVIAITQEITIELARDEEMEYADLEDILKMALNNLVVRGDIKKEDGLPISYNYACHYDNAVFTAKKGTKEDEEEDDTEDYKELCVYCPLKMEMNMARNDSRCLDGLPSVLDRQYEIIFDPDFQYSARVLELIKANCVQMAEAIRDWPVKEGILTE